MLQVMLPVVLKYSDLSKRPRTVVLFLRLCSLCCGVALAHIRSMGQSSSYSLTWCTDSASNTIFLTSATCPSVQCPEHLQETSLLCIAQSQLHKLTDTSVTHLGDE